MWGAQTWGATTLGRSNRIPIQTSVLTNPFSYKSIMIQRTHHIKVNIYKVIQLMYRANNFSHFCQIIFLNSIQAPKQERALFHSPAEQTPRVSLLATFAFLLFIPQIKEQNRERSPSTDRPSTSTFIYSSWTIQPIENRYNPGPHVPVSFKMAD